MKFWDSSALVPLLVEEDFTSHLCELYLREDGILAWWGSEVECASAVARLERETRLPPRAATLAFQRLDALARSWHRVEPVEVIRQTAKRFLRVHPLRAAGALQLAAAFLASEGQPSTLGFVCLDDRLSTAAQREGFHLIDESSFAGYDAPDPDGGPTS